MQDQDSGRGKTSSSRRKTSNRKAEAKHSKNSKERQVKSLLLSGAHAGEARFDCIGGDGGGPIAHDKAMSCHDSIATLLYINKYGGWETNDDGELGFGVPMFGAASLSMFGRKLSQNLRS